jgi:hypothetical protein
MGACGKCSNKTRTVRNHHAKQQSFMLSELPKQYRSRDKRTHLILTQLFPSTQASTLSIDLLLLVTKGTESNVQNHTNETKCDHGNSASLIICIAVVVVVVIAVGGGTTVISC